MTLVFAEVFLRPQEHPGFVTVKSKPQWKIVNVEVNFASKWIGCATSPFFLFSFACFFPQFFFRSLSGVQLDPSKAWCPMLECQAVCSVTPGTEGKPLPVPCPACHAVFCCSCRSPWINGHSCSQHQPLMAPSEDRSVWPIYHWTNNCLSFSSITRPCKRALCVVSAVYWAALIMMQPLNSVQCVASI